MCIKLSLFSCPFIGLMYYNNNIHSCSLRTYAYSTLAIFLYKLTSVDSSIEDACLAGKRCTRDASDDWNHCYDHGCSLPQRVGPPINMQTHGAKPLFQIWQYPQNLSGQIDTTAPYLVTETEVR